jgi:formylglycine-generating enzyme required for sulfatase activity
LLIAGIWSHDEYEWKAEVGIPAEQVRLRNASSDGRNLGIDELAAYVEGDQWKFVAVWSGHPETVLETRVSLIEPQKSWQATFNANSSSGLQPYTYQLAAGPDGDLRRTQIWRRSVRSRSYAQRTAVTADRLAAPGRGYVAVDISTHLGWRDKPYGVVWIDSPFADNKALFLESADSLPNQWASQELRGFRPVAISVASDPSRRAPLSVSVWQRQAPAEEAQQRYADIKSNVIAALLSLGETDATLPFLRHDTDPTLRNYVFKKLAAARVSVNVFEPCLQNRALDADVRQALILALGNYARSAVPAADRARIGQSLQEIYLTDKNIGVRSAAEWVLRRWDLAVPQSGSADADALAHRNWFVTPSGQTMAVLDYPDHYEPRGAAKPPANHRFAIATKEITVKEFAKFRPEHRIDYRARGNDACPAHMMDWYSAVAYCNWLNEQEGIEQDEWCYLPNDEGKYAEGMTIAPDFLARRGYRLPLAAEWLYAASAATRTPFFFGTDDELLLDYAWMARNSQGVHHPVGMLQPNRFGLFDVYGNVREWSHSLDSVTPTDVQVTEENERSVLGGCFDYFQLQFRANYAKHGNPPALLEHRNGIRVVRTILPATAD